MTSGVVSSGVVSGASGVVSPGVDALGVVSPGVVSDGAGLDSFGAEVAGASVVVFADVFMILSLSLFLQEDSEAAVSSTVSDSAAAAHTFNFLCWSPYCRSSRCLYSITPRPFCQDRSRQVYFGFSFEG